MLTLVAWALWGLLGACLSVISKLDEDYFV